MPVLGHQFLPQGGKNVVFSRKPKTFRVNPLAFFTLREKKYTFFYFPKAEYLTSFGEMRNYAELPDTFHFNGSFAQSECHIITFDNEEEILYYSRNACLYRHGFPVLPTISFYDKETQKTDRDFVTHLNFKKQSVTLSIDGSSTNSILLTLCKGKKKYDLRQPNEQEMNLFFLTAMHYTHSHHDKKKKKSKEYKFLHEIPLYDVFVRDYGISPTQSDLESDIRSSIETIEVRKVEISSHKK